MDRQQDVIRRITAHVTAYRFWRHNQIIDERRELRAMAIEIKGLKAKALAARAHLDKINQAYDRFNDMAPVHAADVFGLSEQLTDMQSDLEFAAIVMGNSADASEKLPAASAVRPNIQAGVGDLNQPKPAPESIVAQQGTITTDRVALGPHPDQPEGQQPASQQTGSATASADPQPNGAAVLELKGAAE